MNAGAYEKQVDDVLLNSLAYDYERCEMLVLDRGEHDYAYEAIDDKDHKVICKNSGKELDVEAHTFGEMIDDPENPGWKYQLCDKCGYKLLDESGETGDHSMIAVVAATLSMMGIAVVVSKKKEF